jgi:hypothetical protein
MLSMGSKAAWSMFAGPGDGARLAICGRGENEKLGEKAKFRPVFALDGMLRVAVMLGGVNGGTGFAD